MRKTIFIIDDDPLVRLLIKMMISKIDSTLTLIPCEDGKIGLEKLIEHQGNEFETIVLLDLNMPVVDGWGVLDEIQSPQFNNYQNITLYILSSSTDKVDIERAKQYAIVKKFFHKPLSRINVTEILNFNVNNRD